MDNPAFIWFIIGVALFILELLAPALIVMFFGIGAWLVALLSLLGVNNVNTQILVFAISSVILMLTLRRYAKKWFKGDSNDEAEGVSGEFIGKDVIVTKAIPGGVATGTIELKGANWNAICTDPVEKDAMVQIINRDGLTMEVKAI